MTTPLWIWSTYHIIVGFSALFSDERSSMNFALTSMSWMTWGAMLWSGHNSWFLWTNVPVVCILVLGGFAQLGKPPTPDAEEKASILIWGAALRLFTVLSCWFFSF